MRLPGRRAQSEASAVTSSSGMADRRLRSPAFYFSRGRYAFDVERRRVMQEPIQDRGAQDVIVEDLAQVREALVAGHDEAPSLVTTDQQTEENRLAFSRDRGR